MAVEIEVACVQIFLNTKEETKLAEQFGKKGGKSLPDLLYSLVTSNETISIWVVLHNKF